MAPGIVIVAAGFFLMGVGGLVSPLLIVRQFGMQTDSAAARSEVRAVYGGFGIAASALLVWCLAQPTAPPFVLLTLALALAGMAAGRFVSAALDRSFPRVAVLYTAVELIAAALLLWPA